MSDKDPFEYYKERQARVFDIFDMCHTEAVEELENQFKQVYMDEHMSNKESVDVARRKIKAKITEDSEVPALLRTIVLLQVDQLFPEVVSGVLKKFQENAGQ